MLVASEGAHRLFELNAVAIDPGITPVHEQALGSSPDPTEPAPTRCGAPSGIALSPDEKLAYVWCRSTGDVALVELGTASEARNVRVRHLADDPLPVAAARGRRAFYDASDPITSGGLACSGCHPEGRDDGHVWMEVDGPFTKAPIFVGAELLRAGLVPPPRLARPLTPQEERGRDVFSGAETGCAGCHPPATDYTARVAVPLKQPPPTAASTFTVEANDSFKTPARLSIEGEQQRRHRWI